MSFKKKGYQIISDFLTPDLSSFLYEYLHLKEKVFYTLHKNKLISPYNIDYGKEGDDLVKGAYCLYGDTTMDTLLQINKKRIQKLTNMKLIESYTYARLYKKGNSMPLHTDREECPVSLTLNLGGDVWPIHITDLQKKDNSVALKPGQAMLYDGITCPHWRNKFEGEYCGQLFLHYVPIKQTPYDKRPHLGIPSCGRHEHHD